MPAKKQKKTNRASNKQINRNKSNSKANSNSKKQHKHASMKHAKKASPKVAAKPVKLSKEAKAKNAEKLEKQQLKEAQEQHQRRATELITNKMFLETMNKEVGANAHDILGTLTTGAKVDEDIATQLNMKVNDVRRMLNVMNGYSIVRYDVNKDSKGWLIFKWRIDNEKLSEYITEMEKTTVEQGPDLQGNCNDFFMCKKCYVDQKVVLPFDSAFEYNFTCDGCGKALTILNREQTVTLFKETNSAGAKSAPSS